MDIDIFWVFFAAVTTGPIIAGLIGIGVAIVMRHEERKLKKKIQEFKRSTYER